MSKKFESNLKNLLLYSSSVNDLFEHEVPKQGARFMMEYNLCEETNCIQQIRILIYSMNFSAR